MLCALVLAAAAKRHPLFVPALPEDTSKDAPMVGTDSATEGANDSSVFAFSAPKPHSPENCEINNAPGADRRLHTWYDWHDWYDGTSVYGGITLLSASGDKPTAIGVGDVDGGTTFRSDLLDAPSCYLETEMVLRQRRLRDETTPGRITHEICRSRVQEFAVRCAFPASSAKCAGVNECGAPSRRPITCTKDLDSALEWAASTLKERHGVVAHDSVVAGGGIAMPPPGRTGLVAESTKWAACHNMGFYTGDGTHMCHSHESYVRVISATNDAGESYLNFCHSPLDSMPDTCNKDRLICHVATPGTSMTWSTEPVPAEVQARFGVSPA